MIVAHFSINCLMGIRSAMTPKPGEITATNRSRGSRHQGEDAICGLGHAKEGHLLTVGRDEQVGKPSREHRHDHESRNRIWPSRTSCTHGEHGFALRRSWSPQWLPKVGHPCFASYRRDDDCFPVPRRSRLSGGKWEHLGTTFSPYGVNTPCARCSWKEEVFALRSRPACWMRCWNTTSPSTSWPERPQERCWLRRTWPGRRGAAYACSGPGCRAAFGRITDFLRGGDLVDLELLHETADRLETLDDEALMMHPARFLLTVTDVDTGLGHVLEPSSDELTDALKATSALPIAVRSPIRVRNA